MMKRPLTSTELTELARGLHRLARNLWWTWDQGAQEIFQELSPRGWQNLTIEDFLEAALAWAEASNFGRSQGVDDSANPWRRLAIFLYCGKIYE